MIVMKKGCHVPCAALLREGYQAYEWGYKANVGADHAAGLFRDYISLLEEPVYFFIEIPCTRDEELEINPSIFDEGKEGEVTIGTGPLHRKEYLLDGLDRATAMELLDHLGDLLIHDGLCVFGFGRPSESGEEIQFHPYNVLLLITGERDQCKAFLESHQIFEDPHFQTAWDTFTEDAPGFCEAYKEGGRSVFDIPQLLAPAGMRCNGVCEV